MRRGTLTTLDTSYTTTRTEPATAAPLKPSEVRQRESLDTTTAQSSVFAELWISTGDEHLLRVGILIARSGVGAGGLHLNRS